MILIIKQMLVLLRQNNGDCLSKARGVVSKDLESSKQHSMWVQIKDYSNIKYLLFKYLIFYHKCQPLISIIIMIIIIFFFFGGGGGMVLNVILNYPEYLEIEYHL